MGFQRLTVDFIMESTQPSAFWYKVCSGGSQFASFIGPGSAPKEVCTVAIEWFVKAI
jgi:hypothetical protein